MCNVDALLVAHHRDDVIETYLLKNLNTVTAPSKERELKLSIMFLFLNKIEKNNEIHIPMVYTPLHLHNFINKIDIVLYNSDSSDIGVPHSEYKYNK